MKKVVVVGGGTAGCISALLFKNKFPDMDVSIVRSSTIGVVGPGEGLTPLINVVLNRLNISVEEFLENTDGTIKNGIAFIGWGKNSPQYFHPFYNGIANSAGEFDSNDDFFKYYDIAISNDNNLDKINFGVQHSYLDKVSLDNPNYYAFHIDSRKAIKYFESVAQKIGINIIDAAVTKIINNEKEYIDYIELDNGKSVSGDFYIDATGFHRLILQKHYGVEWVSSKKYLPSSKAIACIKPIGKNDKIHPYTEAIAMNYGWAWKIPLQSRYGCGYVYNDKYINEEEAEYELKEKLGHNVEVVGKFTFNPGYLKEIIHKNCMAVGLAASFIEPLEATAIDNVINEVEGFLQFHFDDYMNNKNEAILSFNKFCEKANEVLVSFVYLHYMTKKSNTEFWSNFLLDYPEPNLNQFSFKTILSAIKNKQYSSDSFNPPSWRLNSWLSIYSGNELNNVVAQFDNETVVGYNKVKQRILDMSNGCIPHEQYLKNIKRIGE